MITRDMLTVKGPGTGISPANLDFVVGKIAKEDVGEDVILPKTAVDLN